MTHLRTAGKVSPGQIPFRSLAGPIGRSAREGLWRKITALIAALFVSVQPSSADEEEREVVVLLHGLARTARSMEGMAKALRGGGYKVCNLGYPSRKLGIEELALRHVLPEIQRCVGSKARRIDFVTHSLGGIIVRQLRASGAQLQFGRVVMLGPPNGGSEVVDKLGDLALFEWINGPAGQQLGTQEGSVPRSLGATDLDLGVIAGKDSINPILSWMIPGEDDGKVSIENAKLAGMKDFLVVPVSHPFLMQSPVVIEQTIHFLKLGRFEHDTQKVTRRGRH